MIKKKKKKRQAFSRANSWDRNNLTGYKLYNSAFYYCSDITFSEHSEWGPIWNVPLYAQTTLRAFVASLL